MRPAKSDPLDTDILTSEPRHSRDAAPTPSPSLGAPRWLRILLPAILIVAWLGLSAVGGPYFGRISEVSSNDQVSYLPARATSTKVQALQGRFSSSTTVPAIVVYARAERLTADDQAFLTVQRTALGKVPGVRGDPSPVILSSDRKAAQIVVPLADNATTDAATKALRQVITVDRPSGLDAYLTGPAGFGADLGQAFGGIDGILLVVALVAVLIILVAVYRSPLLPFLVLATALFALCGAILVVWWLAKVGTVRLNGQVQGILFILVIGAATDYSLLYTARYRDALRDHRSRWDATWAAYRGSFEPILASGATVIAGLLCLLLSDLNSNKALGPVTAIGIGFALLAALTFLPSVLLACGRVAFWPVRPAYGSLHPQLAPPEDSDAPVSGLWPRVARRLSARPRVVWVACGAVLLVACAGVLQLRASGIPQSEVILGASQARDGQKVLAAHFPGGSGSPAVVVAPADRLQQVARAVLGQSGVDSLAVVAKDSPSGTFPVTKDGIQPLGPPGTPAGKPTVVDGQVLLQATLSAAADSADAERTVRALRHTLDSSFGAGTVQVGGVTAISLDTNDASVHDRNLIIPVVLAVILVILTLLLRSLVAPVLLVASVVLSFAATLGISALVFNHLFAWPGADPSVPLYGFVFLVALGIDYNIFLMTRVREESQRHRTRTGVLRGLIVTGGVITSAGMVLASTFAALGVIPVLFLAQIAFLVAFGVLLDTVVVRSLLVPALCYDLGANLVAVLAFPRARPASARASDLAHLVGPSDHRGCGRGW